MGDLVYLAVGVGFFGACVALAQLFENLLRQRGVNPPDRV